MDPDAELKKQIDSLRDSLIVLSMVENKSSQRIQSHEERLLDQEQLTAKHTQWLLDHEMAMKRHEESMSQFDQKVNALAMNRHAEFIARHEEVMMQIDQKLNMLVAIVDDMIRGKRP